MARRTRRSRMGQNRMTVVRQLIDKVESDQKTLDYLTSGQRSKAFGRLLNTYLDETRESVIDRYVDEEAKDATSYALNIVAKQVKEGISRCVQVDDTQNELELGDTQEATVDIVEGKGGKITININL